jgi:hypothetical protein
LSSLHLNWQQSTWCSFEQLIYDNKLTAPVDCGGGVVVMVVVAAVAAPARGSEDGIDERKKKVRVFIVSIRRVFFFQKKKRVCVLFFPKQLHFLNSLILAIGLIFATCHTSMQ